MRIEVGGKNAAIFTIILFVMASMSFIPITSGDIQASTNIPVNSGPDTNRIAPDLATDSNGIAYCVWGDRRAGNWDVYFTKSTDFGVSWDTPDKKVNTGSGDQSYPSIAVDNQGNIYVVWEDFRNGNYDIYFSSSSDGGKTWLTPNIMINSDTNGFPEKEQRVPQIAVDHQGTIFVVWSDYRHNNFDIYFNKSEDGGNTWLAENVRVNRDPEPSPDQMNPTIAVDPEGNLFVAWEENVGTHSDIFLTKSENGGIKWNDTHVKVNSDSGDETQTRPVIAADFEGNLYMAWEDKRNTNNRDIYFAASTDGGVSWTHPNVKVDNSTSGKQQNPAISVGVTGTVYVAWDDDRKLDNDIYFSYSINKGETWLVPDVNVIDDTGGTQRLPAIGTGGSGPVYLAWRDNRNNPNDIYSAFVGAIHPFPFADQLTVEGYSGGTPEIMHIIEHKPEFGFKYTDPGAQPSGRYNISMYDSTGSSLLWFCNMTDSVPSGSVKTVTYNTAPCPENGPALVDGISYILRVKVANSTDNWSPQAEVTFHLNEVLRPISPETPEDSSLLEAKFDQLVGWTSPGDDSEGDSPVNFFWEVAMDPDFSDIIESGSGLVTRSGTFDTTPSGTFYWRVKLSDGWETGSYSNQPDGFWDFTSYTDSGENEPPVITNKADVPTEGKVNSSISFTFLATDPDGDKLSWSKTQGPYWVSIGRESGNLTAIPALEYVGANTITIQVSDGRGGRDTHTFTLTVTEDSNGGGNGDGDDGVDEDTDFTTLCLLFILIVIIILLLLFFIIAKRRKKEDEEEEGKQEEEDGTKEDEEKKDLADEDQDELRGEEAEEGKEVLSDDKGEDSKEGPEGNEDVESP
jgi:hypothetical protein